MFSMSHSFSNEHLKKMNKSRYSSYKTIVITQNEKYRFSCSILQKVKLVIYVLVKHFCRTNEFRRIYYIFTIRQLIYPDNRSRFMVLSCSVLKYTQGLLLFPIYFVRYKPLSCLFQHNLSNLFKKGAIIQLKKTQLIIIFQN